MSLNAWVMGEKRIQYLGVLAKLFLEDADRTRATNIMGHQNVNVNPSILTRAQLAFLRSPSQYLLSHRHCCLDLKSTKIPPLKSTKL